MTPSQQPKQAGERRDNGQPATSGVAEGALTMKALEAVVGRVALGGEESSSSGGQGSGGSGGGYTGDISSSDCSSESSSQRSRTVSHMLVDKSTFGKGQESHDGDRNESMRTDELLEALHKSFMGRGSLPAMDSVTSATTLPTHQGPMPQLNGVRIQHPMDPRIDLSSVGYVNTGYDPGMPVRIVGNGPVDALLPAATVLPPSEDHYMHVLEAVRPFFSAYGLQQVEKPVQQNGGSASDALSSEGFTSFFTTTTSSDSNSSSKKQESGAKPQDTETDVAKSVSNPNEAVDESDASSMVVLARVKRKHLKREADQSTTGSNSTTSSEGREEQAEPHQRPDGENIQRGAEHHEQGGPPPAAAQEAAQQESSSSSSSSDDRANNDAPQGPLHVQQQLMQAEGAGIHHYSMTPRIVSESSDRHSSTASNVMTTTTSGSGSGGNSGSGSANGSSGSGNEGKGSSTDNAKGEHSGDANSNSDENNTGKEKKVTEADANAEHWKALADPSLITGTLHQHGTPMLDSGVRPPTVAFNRAMYPQDVSHKEDGQGAVREKKLLDKKRKRMNMRREYEEHVQQQMESSESSHGPSEVFLRPGKPVSLDEVLSFAKTARLVVQGNPPFLVVYANAAYALLTGIECHSVIGKPISALVSIPEPTNGNGETMYAGEDSSVSQIQDSSSSPQGLSQEIGDMGRASTEEAGRAHAPPGNTNVDMSLEHLIATSGFGRYHMINVCIKPRQGSHPSSLPSVEMVSSKCRMGVSPVVASSGTGDMAVVTDQDQSIRHHHHHSGAVGKHHSLKRTDHAGEGAPTFNGVALKRRKHHQLAGDSDSLLSSRALHRRMLMLKDANSRISQHNVISHFAIQLELVDVEALSKDDHHLSAGSFSSATTSTKAEARLYGISTAEVKRRRIAINADIGEVGQEDVAASRGEPPPVQEDGLQGDLDGEIDAESVDSDPKEPVAAIG